MKYQSVTSILMLVLLVPALESCERPECRSENPVFNNNSIESLEYKRELVKNLQGNTGSLTYWVAGYIEKDNLSFLEIWIQGDDLCARTLMEVREWGKLSNIMEKKGMGYRGAKLEGLTFDILVDQGDIRFVYKNVDSIQD